MNTESESYEMRLWIALQELVHAIEKGAPEEVVWREIHDANKLLNEPFNEFTGLLLRTINAGIDAGIDTKNAGIDAGNGAGNGAGNYFA